MYTPYADAAGMLLHINGNKLQGRLHTMASEEKRKEASTTH
jgi:hypothetical protein